MLVSRSEFHDLVVVWKPSWLKSNTRLVAQIDDLGNTTGIWPKMIFLNTKNKKADELYKSAEKFALDVKV
jgi:hypothetical protein